MPTHPAPPPTHQRIRTTLLAAFVIALGLSIGIAARCFSVRRALGGPLLAGSTIPAVFLQARQTGAVPLSDVISRSPSTTLVIFSLGCSNCLGEAAVWQRIAKARNSSGAVVGAVCGAEWDQVDDFVAETGIQFPIFGCDRQLTGEMRVIANPTILEISSNGIVQFGAAGTAATSEIETYLKESGYLDAP